MCKTRGFTCGAKVLGPKAQHKETHWELVDIEPTRHAVVPISRPISTPDDMLLISTDVQYLQYQWDGFNAANYRSARYGVDFYSLTIQIPLQRAMLHFSSKPLRYADLALSSAVKNGKILVDSLSYLGLFYEQAKAQIANCSYVDVLFELCHTLYALAL